MGPKIALRVEFVISIRKYYYGMCSRSLASFFFLISLISGEVDITVTVR